MLNPPLDANQLLVRTGPPVPQILATYESFVDSAGIAQAGSEGYYFHPVDIDHSTTDLWPLDFARAPRRANSRGEIVLENIFSATNGLGGYKHKLHWAWFTDTTPKTWANYMSMLALGESYELPTTDQAVARFTTPPILQRGRFLILGISSDPTRAEFIYATTHVVLI
jgi:hypothetical protein